MYKRPVGAHERDHRAIGGVGECPLEVGLDVVGILQQALDRVGRLPDALAGEVAADRGGLERMVDVEEPVGDVDPVDHQVGEEAAAEVPEPAPVAEAILVERLVGGVPEEVLPGDLAGIDARASALKRGRAAAVPAQVDLEDLADPAALRPARALSGCAACSAAACRPGRSCWFRFWASMIAAPSARSCVSGFST